MVFCPPRYLPLFSFIYRLILFRFVFDIKKYIFYFVSKLLLIYYYIIIIINVNISELFFTDLLCNLCTPYFIYHTFFHSITSVVKCFVSLNVHYIVFKYSRRFLLSLIVIIFVFDFIFLL